MGIAHLDTADRPPTSPDPEARLRLVDSLRQAGDGRACAETALAWLADHAGCGRSLLLVVDPEEDQLRGLCCRGCDDEAARAMTVDLADRSHPLVVALESQETVSFDGPEEGQRRPPPETPLGPVPFLAFPLCPEAETPHGAVGLLLLEDPDRRSGLKEVLEWVGSLLATRLAALAYFRHQKTRKRQRRERDWLRGVLETVTDPILLTDGQGRILIANSGAEHLLTTDEETGEGRRRAVALNNMLFSASLFTNAEEGGPSRRELLLVDPVDGHDLLFELMTTPFPLEEAEVGMVSILRDVTDLSRATTEIEENYRRLRAAESDIRAERDRLDVILSSVLDPILVTDPAGNIVLMNPHAERLFTVPSGNQDREAERRVRANDAVFTSFASDIYAGRSLRWRKDLTLSDPETGKQIPMEAVSAKTLSRPGQETAVVTILHDQSEAVEKAKLYEQVKRHSEELEERVRDATRELADQNELLRRQALQLEHASAMKSQFLANVSHELRTPLHAIVGYTSVMMEGLAGDLTPPQREKLDRVDSNAQHLLAIINDLLDLTRIESGKMPVRIERFRLCDLFDEVKTEAESLILASNLQVGFDVRDDLPAMASDRQKVKQILLNLLSNALKFTPDGRVDVEGAWDEEDDRVSIAVADTGVGISEKHQKTIFEAFGQTGTFYTAGQTGTGLGLSICRRLATILGGDMTLESEEGEGARFTLELPRTSEET